jgi:cytoskeletal protein RodZ
MIAKGRKNPLEDGAMPTVSEQLRQAREKQKLTVHQVAEVTKIRTDHLRALEEGNFDVFSAPVYIRGFVRSYCNLLKLDVPQIMSELDAELGRTQKFAEPPPFSEHPRGVLDFFMLQLSKIDWRKGLIALSALLVLLIVFFVFLIYHHYRTADPLSDLKPGMYHSTQAVSGQTLPLPVPRR